jgi:DNA-binding CsgD family transcriptional regulator
MTSWLSGSSLRLIIAPIAGDPMHFGRPVALTIIFIFSDTTRPRVDPGALTFIYRISPAESRAVAKSAEGYTLAQIAQLFFLSIETVRTHVKHALVKLDCPSQSALIREILLGPAVALRAGDRP